MKNITKLAAIVLFAAAVFTSCKKMLSIIPLLSTATEAKSPEIR